MKNAAIILAVCLGVSGAAYAQDTAPPPPAKGVCLPANLVDHTTVLSDTEILFHMKNRKIWKNTLHQTCTGLKFEHGFSEDIRGNMICANMQTIRVLRQGSICSLGDFTPYTPPPKTGQP